MAIFDQKADLANLINLFFFFERERNLQNFNSTSSITESLLFQQCNMLGQLDFPSISKWLKIAEDVWRGGLSRDYSNPKASAFLSQITQLANKSKYCSTGWQGRVMAYPWNLLTEGLKFENFQQKTENILFYLFFFFWRNLTTEGS